MYVYLSYSKQGYEIAYVGQSVNTARYAGINVKNVIMRTMAISGAICGIAGFMLVSGAGHTISTGIAGGRGFTAIVVAWLSKLNTFTMMFVSFLLTFMEKGAIQIASQFNLSENASRDILTGIILFFVLGCEFFINYKVSFRHGKKEDRRMNAIIIFIQKAIGQGIGILFGANGEILTEKSGNLNLGVPGMMYMGGIAGLAGAFLYENAAANPLPVVGIACFRSRVALLGAARWAD